MNQQSTTDYNGVPSILHDLGELTLFIILPKYFPERPFRKLNVQISFFITIYALSIIYLFIINVLENELVKYSLLKIDSSIALNNSIRTDLPFISTF